MFSFSIAAPAIPLSLFLQRSPLGFLVGIKHSLTNFRLPSSVAKINRWKSAASWSLIAFLALLQSCLKFGLSSKKLKICEHYQVFFGKVPDFLPRARCPPTVVCPCRSYFSLSDDFRKLESEGVCPKSSEIVFIGLVGSFFYIYIVCL